MDIVDAFEPRSCTDQLLYPSPPKAFGHVQGCTFETILENHLVFWYEGAFWDEGYTLHYVRMWIPIDELIDSFLILIAEWRVSLVVRYGFQSRLPVASGT